MMKITWVLLPCGFLIGLAFAAPADVPEKPSAAASAVGDSQPTAAVADCAECDDAKVASDDPPKDACLTGICPIYQYMQHSGYCSWYALRCMGQGISPQACSWAGSCGQSPAVNPCSPGCQNCQEAEKLKVGAAYRPTGEKHEVASGLKKGLKAKKPKEDAVMKSGAVAINPNKEKGELVWFLDESGVPKVIYAQIWKVEIVSGVVAYVGHEVEQVETQEKAVVESQDERVFKIRVPGYNEPFVVIAEDLEP